MMPVQSGKLANTFVVKVAAQLGVNHFNGELEQDSQAIEHTS